MSFISLDREKYALSFHISNVFLPSSVTEIGSKVQITLCLQMSILTMQLNIQDNQFHSSLIPRILLIRNGLFLVGCDSDKF